MCATSCLAASRAPRIRSLNSSLANLSAWERAIASSSSRIASFVASVRPTVLTPLLPVALTSAFFSPEARQYSSASGRVAIRCCNSSPSSSTKTLPVRLPPFDDHLHISRKAWSYCCPDGALASASSASSKKTFREAPLTPLQISADSPLISLLSTGASSPPIGKVCKEQIHVGVDRPQEQVLRGFRLPTGLFG